MVRTLAIPTACYPYSNSSRIVHWLTRHEGKISTLLKGALRPKSPFLGEYDLFCTSELLYFDKRLNTLHTGKECSIMHRRDGFRTDWRAMQTASYLTALFDKSSPDEAPQPELFELYEELLDLAEEHGRHYSFLIWAELRFCEHQGHAPGLRDCVLCRSTRDLRFCASQGGVVCQACSRHRRLPVLECSPDILAMLQTWQRTERAAGVTNTRISAKQRQALDAIMGTFMMYQFSLPPEHRGALLFN